LSSDSGDIGHAFDVYGGIAQEPSSRAIYSDVQRRGRRQHVLSADDELIRRCLAGDERGWGGLVLKYRRLIYSVALKCGATCSEADDIFQTVCLVLLEKLDTLRETSKLGTWLLTTASRMSWTVVEKRRRKENSAGAAYEMTDPVVSGSLPEQELVRLEMQNTVRWAVEQLPRRCRSMITYLFYLEKPLSYQEIGRRLGIPPGSVGPTRARCLEKLRAVLGRRGYR